MQFTLKIEGMTCGGCVRSVEKALAGVAGLKSAKVDLGKAEALIETEAGADPARFLSAVEDAGYDARLAG
ncbi:MAG: heavy metal-associated domain-containing protein [Pseudomonadota bacterium]